MVRLLRGPLSIGRDFILLSSILRFTRCPLLGFEKVQSALKENASEVGAHCSNRVFTPKGRLLA